MKFWSENLKGRDHLRKIRCWEDNITTVLGKIDWEFVDYMHLAQDRDLWRAVVSTVMNLPVP
jgi:hypothetical protein